MEERIVVKEEEGRDEGEDERGEDGGKCILAKRARLAYPGEHGGIVSTVQTQCRYYFVLFFEINSLLSFFFQKIRI